VIFRAATPNNIIAASPIGRFGRFATIASTSPICRNATPPLAGRTVGGALCEVDGRWLQAGAFPIGIDTDAFAQKARAAEKNRTVKRTLASLDGRDLIIGVDRLDYSKGLKHRVAAFALFLERSPEAVRRRATMLQITPKSRSDVAEYVHAQRELAEEVGRINGKFGDVDRTPLRYINKAMSHAALAGLYRMSRIGLVTPLRDGMNLVAKEYVAAQAPDNPGVLVLSQFAGAALELKSALIVNPYDIEATADALARAFLMPLDERKDRWRAMMAVLRANSVHDWASHFLEALATGVEGKNSVRPALNTASRMLSAWLGENRVSWHAARHRHCQGLPPNAAPRLHNRVQKLPREHRRCAGMFCATIAAETLLDP
jgi:trehalose 6-phosphate synthase